MSKVAHDPLLHFIDGEFIGHDNARLDVIEPATGKVFTHVADANKHEIELAVSAAEAALPHWRALSSNERANWLIKLATAIEDQFETLAELESRDSGKPLWVTRKVDIPRAVTNLQFFAHAATQFASEAHAMEQGAINYTLRQPLGAIACISPWNLPLYLLTWKVAPALASGNTVIAKPSELTPVTAHALGRLMQSIGFPKGVLNIIHGRGEKVGRALVTHEKIKAISFTGGSDTGKEIARSCGEQLKKYSLELGGKNPSLVFADCDMKKAVPGILRAAFSNQGQICLCGSRILIERSIYSDFRDALVKATEAMKVGDPLEQDVKQAAVNSLPHLKRIEQFVDDAKSAGGNILCGGHRVQVTGRCADGYFFAPTLIDGLDMSACINQEEVFGPVATLLAFDAEEEAIAMANDSRYGLAASIWSQDVSRTHRVAAQIEAGMVWVNTWLLRDLRTPMGGMKQSGMGREGGFDAMRFFTEPKNVCINYL